MKFMKLGSKPDQFQTDEDNIRYVATDLATDIVIIVGDVKFYLHKFPLLSKSSHLQKLVSGTPEEENDETTLHDIPGGPAAFEICAKFCYGMIVTLNAYNVVAARCAAEYLEMYETVEKGNLIYKIDVFLTSSIFRSWKDSIIVLQTAKNLLPWSEELKIVTHCLDSIANKASTDPSRVDWSYTYNRKKLSSENGSDSEWNGVKKHQTVPKDWWVEDLCELQIDLYKRVLTAIRAKGRMNPGVVGESLRAYSLRRLPEFGTLQGGGDFVKYRYLVKTVIFLLPAEKNSVPCGFLLKLLHACVVLECGEAIRGDVMVRIWRQLEEASVSDLLIRSSSGETRVYNIDIVHELVEKFVMQEHSAQSDCDHEFEAGFNSDGSKMKVARLVDGYLAEAARDSNLGLSKFFDLAEMVSSFPRSTHDGIYRAIDMYLKEHLGLTKSEKKRLCGLMNCRKLSPDACAHAVQNERLPLRVVVQVLFFEQTRAAPPSASGGSGSVSATTNTDEDWDGEQTSEEIKALRGELMTLRLRNRGGESGAKSNVKVVSDNKVKKILSRLWSNKDSSSDTSESPASTSAEETRSTPSRSRRHS